MPVEPDNITGVLNEIARIGAAVADAIGAGFEIDRPYNLDDEDFPLVIMRTGGKKTVPDENMPTSAWDEVWELTPSIEIFLNGATPTLAAAARNAASQILRDEIRRSNILDYTRDGIDPDYEETLIGITDRPGSTGLSGDFVFTVYRD